jgi:HEAT repeat protein
MHDHRLVAPDPTLTERLGVPNACGTCHAAEGPAWAARALAAWGAHERPRRRWATALHGGNRGDPASVTALLDCLDAPGVPWPTAATAGRLLARFPEPAVAPALRAALLHAEHPAVRAGAAYGLVGQPGEAALGALREALDDPIASVRVMVAAALLARGDAAGRAPALGVVDAVLRGIPDDLALRRLRGFALEQAGALDAALAEHGRARRCAPLDPAVAAAEAACRARAEAR